MPFPEPAEAIDWQLARVQDGTKRACLVPYWQPAIGLLKVAGLVYTATPSGTVWTRRGDFSHAAIIELSLQGRLGTLLGYPQDAKPLEATGCVTLRDAGGVELWSQAVDDETEDAAWAAANALLPYAASAVLEDVLYVVMQRIRYWENRYSTGDF